MKKKMMYGLFVLFCIFLFGLTGYMKVNAKEVSLHEIILFDNPKTLKKLIEAGADVNAKDEDGNTPLHEAVSQGENEIVKVLIAAGADVNTKDEDGSTPLHEAVSQRETEIVKVLIAAGADVNTKDEDGSTPLHKAVSQGENEIVKVLIAAGAYVNAKDEDGNMPLHEAVSQGETEIVKVLIAAGADVNTKDEYGRTLLQEAVSQEKTEIAKALIAAGADMNTKDEYGRTLLLEALYWDQNEIAKALIAAGADVNTKDKGGDTPLHKTEDAEIAKALIEAGADVNANNNDGRTPLHWVANAEIARLLTDKGADVNAKDEDGDTPLHKTDDAEIARLLIDKGADINAKNEDGDTPLHKTEDAEIAKVLIEAGVDIHAKDEYGETPLHWALNTAVAKALIEAGADINTKNNEGKTPLWQFINKKINNWAYEDNRKMIQILLEAGADVNTQDKNGKTPLMKTVETGNLQTVQILLQAGADVNIQDKRGHTPLWFANISENKNVAETQEMIDILLSHGANVKNIPLDLIHSAKLAKAAINEGADVNQRVPHSTGYKLFNKENQPYTTFLHLVQDEKAAQFLIDKGADVNAKNSDGKIPLETAYNAAVYEVIAKAMGKDGTTLFTAARNNDTALASKLVEKGANVNQCFNNETPLTQAVKSGHIEMVQWLLNHGANIKMSACSSGDNKTPILLLSYQSVQNNPRLAEILLNAGADFNKDYPKCHIEKPAKQAVKTENIPFLKVLIKHGAKTDFDDDSNRCSIIPYLISKIENTELEKLLIQNSENVNISYNGKSLFKRFVEKNNIDIIKLLLQKGVNQFEKNAALLYAVQKNQKELVTLLLNNGVHVNTETPLHEVSDVEIAKALIAAGANVNAKNAAGETPLFSAVHKGNSEIVQTFLQAGATVNTPDSDGTTPLSEAARLGHSGIVQMLLQAGADVNMPDFHNNTPYICAKTPEIKTLLLQAGAKESHKECKVTKTLIDHQASSIMGDPPHCYAEDPLMNPHDPWFELPLWWAKTWDTPADQLVECAYYE